MFRRDILNPGREEGKPRSWQRPIFGPIRPIPLFSPVGGWRARSVRICARPDLFGHVPRRSVLLRLTKTLATSPLQTKVWANASLFISYNNYLPLNILHLYLFDRPYNLGQQES